ncbi:MAG: PEGA domain-containing protein [Planctomycetota bacterium]
MLRLAMLLFACVFVSASLGCAVKRTLVLESEPAGALVFLNGEEVARTPAEVPLDWYGKYDVVVRKPGFETQQTERWVAAPWWQWVPIDLVAELLPIPLSDTRRLSFTLEPAAAGDEGVLARAEAMRDELVPTTRPATRPAE